MRNYPGVSGHPILRSAYPGVMLMTQTIRDPSDGYGSPHRIGRISFVARSKPSLLPPRLHDSIHQGKLLLISSDVLGYSKDRIG